jgi:hypothetical protein
MRGNPVVVSAADHVKVVLASEVAIGTTGPLRSCKVRVFVSLIQSFRENTKCGQPLFPESNADDLDNFLFRVGEFGKLAAIGTRMDLICHALRSP